jgi:ATP-binding protein involved in chromosome partitioning
MLGMKGTEMDVEMDQEKRKLVPPEYEGIKVVSFGFFAQQEHQAAIYRGPIISGIVKQFLVDTLWTDLDYLIVDLPPGTGDIPLTLAQTIPITGILVVTTPQEVASSVASKAIGMFDKLNVPMLGVVENMSYFECSKCNEKHYIFGKGGAERISEKHNMPFLGAIPLNSGIMEGSELGKPVMITQPDSPSAEAFTVAAKNVAAQCSIQHYKMKEEAEAEAKWDGLSPEERQKILDEIHDTTSLLEHFEITPEHENKTWAELEHEIQVAIIQHLFGKPKVQTTPTTS